MTSPAVPDPWRSLRALTPARIALGRAGVSLPTAAHLDFQLAHARARDAVKDTLDAAALERDLGAAGFSTISVHSAAPDQATYLQRPDLGRRLGPASRERLAAAAVDGGFDAVVVLADGLSARAVQRHGVPVLNALAARLRAEWRLAPVVVAERARVALSDEIGSLIGARLALILLGERPGLTAPDSLGGYLTWDPRPGRTDAERNCVSNIRPEGLGYEPAGERLSFIMTEARRRRLSGVGLKDESGVLGA